ncbi:MAG: DUF4062 domain-containing protein [Rhodocyclaceae bacterium]|nr:DUF4062 domain-containing protein [Rhodocyclaceae bacterium]MBX3670821.1 DUF4062 domain-containing protein [Rhodocyclaceae bacterium]
MANVYVSSTLVDLKDERQRVMDWLVAARHLPLHSYTADTETVRDSCLADVDRCDIYVLIVGHRYGFKPTDSNPDGLSITQLEYRRAQGKPRVILERTSVPDISLTDLIDDAKRPAILAFRAEVERDQRPYCFSDAAGLIQGLSTGVQNALEKLQAQANQTRPATAPGAVAPHARALDCGLLLLYAAGSDDACATALAQALGQARGGLRVETLALAAERAPDWPRLDNAVCRARSTALVSSAAGYKRLAAAKTLPAQLEFCRRQTGSLFWLSHGINDAPPAAWPVDQHYPLDAWCAAGQAGMSGELPAALAGMRIFDTDLDDPGLVGLQTLLVTMTRAEARALAANPQRIQDEIGGLAGQYFKTVTAALQERFPGWDWTLRYGDSVDAAGNARADQAARDDWQPFRDPAGEAPAMNELLQELVEDLNLRLASLPRRDREALRNYRMRLRPYPLAPLFDENDDAWARTYLQMRKRRCLVIVDELSLCEPRIRNAVGGLVADASCAVVTVAAVDPALAPIEKILAGASVLKVGNLVDRFRNDLDPACELTVGSRARLRRWLRQNIPETLAGGEDAAQMTQRDRMRALAGLS